MPVPNNRMDALGAALQQFLMDRLLLTPCSWDKRGPHEYLPQSKVIPLITLSMLNMISVATRAVVLNELSHVISILISAQLDSCQ